MEKSIRIEVWVFAPILQPVDFSIHVNGGIFMHIYLRQMNKTIEVSKEVHDDYYRDINAFRRTQQKHGSCVCPKANYRYCDMYAADSLRQWDKFGGIIDWTGEVVTSE